MMCCNGCSNNPKNGGSGICNCTLPYMQNPTMYYAEDGCMVNNINGHVFTASNDDLKNNTITYAAIAEAVERTKKYIKE